MANKQKSAEVVPFPESNIVRFRAIPKNNNDSEKILSQHNDKMTYSILKRVGSFLFTRLDAEGLPVSDDQFNKDFSFIMETIRAAILRQYGSFHELQDVMDSVDIIEDDGENQIEFIFDDDDMFDEKKEPGPDDGPKIA